jgi:mannose-6-phosphate isomerase-like protein (cupin superfamily)
MRLALLAILPLLITAPAYAQRARPKAPPPVVPTTATITVTDLSGAPLADVRVTLTGSIDRSGSTQTNGTVKFDGLRPGAYRLRFVKDGFVLFERELDVSTGQPPPNPSVALSPAPVSTASKASPSEDGSAPKPATPPPAPSLPPPGKPVTLAVPDFIEKNFITGSQPQKVSPVGCSGLANTLLWQIREPWENRQHSSADAMLYVIGGDGTLRLGGRDTPMEAGSFASVPRGTVYTLTRRGRNPLIVLATLAGEACP